MDAPSAFQAKKHLYQEIVEKIKQMIVSGEFAMGDRLPAERRLAQIFRVSRNCIRQAIQALAEKHILETRRGDGTYVCAADESALAESFVLAVQFQKELLHDILEFRLMMEPQVARLAARNITREGLDRLKIILCDQQRKVLAGIADGESDADFHMELARASGNRIMLKVFQTMNEILNESRSETLQAPERNRISVEGHLKIINALENRDPDAAETAMKGHLAAVENFILSADKKCQLRVKNVRLNKNSL
ncbi:MAG: FadR/GntR family transcriptional regulator [Desulfobacterales bacterium]